MIDLITGEIQFQDGLVFSPHCSPPEASSDIRVTFPITRWNRINYGKRVSEYGLIDVGAVCNEDSAVRLVVMAHIDSSYDASSAGDSARKQFHEYIVSQDLKGQKEFSWGVVHIKDDPKSEQNWLVVVYTPGANIPIKDMEKLLDLSEHSSID